jgi:hypothetical protein
LQWILQFVSLNTDSSSLLFLLILLQELGSLTTTTTAPSNQCQPWLACRVLICVPVCGQLKRPGVSQFSNMSIKDLGAPTLRWMEYPDQPLQPHFALHTSLAAGYMYTSAEWK